MKPREVLLWQATNRAARDFRLESIGPVWSSSPIPERDGSFSAKVAKPEEGWTAYMVELTFETGAKTPLKLTTNITITPNVLPFPPLKPLQPAGFLSK
jgi:PhoPQ-activated pathogenicity-related protein